MCICWLVSACCCSCCSAAEPAAAQTYALPKQPHGMLCMLSLPECIQHKPLPIQHLPRLQHCSLSADIPVPEVVTAVMHMPQHESVCRLCHDCGTGQVLACRGCAVGLCMAMQVVCAECPAANVGPSVAAAAAAASTSYLAGMGACTMADGMVGAWLVPEAVAHSSHRLCAALRNSR